MGEEYELALSFAGEDRALVETIAVGLRRRRVKIFYDQFEKSKLWGKDLYQYLHEVYSSKAKYCLLFISESYVSKPWPRHEAKAAQEKQLFSESEYILPIRLDDSELPGLASTISYIDARHLNAEEIVNLAIEKLGRSQQTLFRGMDLGHNIDPLSSSLSKLDSVLFIKICLELLSCYKFKIAKEESLGSSILSDKSSIGEGSIYTGLFDDAFSYNQKVFNEIGVGFDENASRIFGKDIHVREEPNIQALSGLAKVVVHAKVNKETHQNDIIAFGKATLANSIQNVIFLVNENFEDVIPYFGAMNRYFQQPTINLVVLFCDDLAYQILTTDIYRKYESQLKWIFKNHL